MTSILPDLAFGSPTDSFPISETCIIKLGPRCGAHKVQQVMEDAQKGGACFDARLRTSLTPVPRLSKGTAMDCLINIWASLNMQYSPPIVWPMLLLL